MKSYTDLNLTRETGSDMQAGEASEREDVNINWLSALSGHQLEMPDPVKIVLVQRLHLMHRYTHNGGKRSQETKATACFYSGIKPH